ncbi:TolC family protein [Estrella lausannensis]|uniref:Putative secreted protein n=1 Tax=Estrella lausannensis TaxID=483423 RepID=A0A0H5E3D6_9BACT|nr:TolC family protein [Estrella lausannensis]CRX37730.1 putative secreted protein [Estrella lausannensis]
MTECSGQKFKAFKSSLLRGASFIIFLCFCGCHRTFQPQGTYVEQALLERAGAAVAVTETLALKAGESQVPVSLLNSRLDAESAAQIALLNNPALKMEMMGIGIKAADLEATMLLPNPSLAFSLFFPSRSSLDKGVEAGISYKIVDLFLMPYRRQAAREAYFSEQMRVLKEALKLINQVKEVFYSLQEARSIVKTTELIKLAAEVKFMLAEKLHAQGNIGDAIFFEAEMELWEAKQDEAEAKINFESSLSKLAVLLGVDHGTISIKEEAEESAPPLVLNEIDRVACDRIDLAILNYDLRRLYSMRPLYSPLSYTFSSLGIDFKHDPEKYDALGPSGVLDIPLFNSGQSDRQRLDYEIGALCFQRQMAWMTAKEEISASIKKYAAAKDKLSFAKERADSAKSSFTSELNLYNVMNVTPLELLDAKRRELEASKRYHQVRGEAMREAVRLKRAMQISLND